MLIVYFSSATGNTQRFVEKVGLPAARIPLHRTEDELIVNEPYVLVCPTYGGGASLTSDNTRPVPKQVIKFLNNEHNRSLIRGVIAAGNSNFGPDFCLAGEVISRKCRVPHLYRFELMGDEHDVDYVREQLVDNAHALGLDPLDRADVDKLAARADEIQQESAQRLERLRKKYDRNNTKKTA
ncbi:class Ib ribonucleoside-diphosphate reductase assembly flavoprotein NrdI [Corynebacterium sanguinis]|uniref:class Ib ribonucleoside-diphosphate reductase assembly flavoprotein NrdI n=2 Tax=Corynebacterium TaxID=1716 RepID=UPI0011A1B175|nr:class Ib ribonucleoside-diphosphate reductase assembly flavoprotein NrdI [Corynebacterium sanguinis]MCT1426045.1 class Ib ribonucleoside-diphosphate reductase assembly flavoprotein NrdI [Corynebacterium sanguinis]MCT1491729.1 class Ib ribonucleoside-diphosphate reductase assembly flavoprotein NrdI [Corynebacterium sanguinis]MCT1584793.1 class Ib ribonucleoside-diphosphate reductase assembly flavoprotein NrdI [Corynebacterium sanguinis]MCT1597188.1 class Ib ribonucleoside-diphosphate reductas